MRTKHYVFRTSDLIYTIDLFSTERCTHKEAGRVQNENFPRRGIFKGCFGGDLGRPEALRGQTPFKSRCNFSALRGALFKPSPETTKGDVWLHLRLPNFTL